MAANKDEGIADEVVDQLLAGRDPATVFESGGLIDELKKRLAERMLNAEMDHHLGNAVEEDTGNHRNGYGSKTVITDTGKLELAIPRDRHGRFDPVLIGKYRRRFAGFDETWRERGRCVSGRSRLNPIWLKPGLVVAMC